MSTSPTPRKEAPFSLMDMLIVQCFKTLSFQQLANYSVEKAKTWRLTVYKHHQSRTLNEKNHGQQVQLDRLGKYIATKY